MTIRPDIAAFHDEITRWRRDLHKHPELAFEEFRTSDFVAEKLAEFGLEVHRGLGGTGVVGTLKAGGGNRAVGLRADMDALPMQEENRFAYASIHPGKMHGCGHDGHTAMLLGAARILSQKPDFSGTVHFIFQPAEEGAGGGKRMVEDGLLEQFPVNGIYGMHNWPGMPVGEFGIRSGPFFAATDTFDLTVKGFGGHAAMPQGAIDPIIIGAQIVTAWQTLVSRNVGPADSAVLSVTQFHAGSANNVIPASAHIAGTVRTMTIDSRRLLEARMGDIARSIAEAMGGEADFTHHAGYPSLVNPPAEADKVADIAADLVGEDKVDRQMSITMGGEDFAFMLEAATGAYITTGNGPAEGGCLLHNPLYDFNDAVIPHGVGYWVRLVETLLPVEQS